MARQAKGSSRRKLQDIPDMGPKAPPPVELEPHVALEREVRRYIRKDGVFIRNVESLWSRPVSSMPNAEGKIVYKSGKTREEAEAFVTELCVKSGRRVERDSLSGRLKAVPGWDLRISVPGMLSSETASAKLSDMDLRMRNNEELIHALKEQNAALMKRLDAMQDKK